MVVEALDAGEDVVLRFIAGCILAVMDQLGLERVEEAFRRGIVVAVGSAAHRRSKAGGLQRLALLG